MSIKITVNSLRGKYLSEEYEVEQVPRIGDIVRTKHLAAARVTDVAWDLRSGNVTLEVR